MTDDRWLIYKGNGSPHDGISHLPEPPPWRAFHVDIADVLDESADRVESTPASARLSAHRARVYQASIDVVEMVNAALYLRRPLLVTGKPGTGKSTLAYSVAHELQLGPVLSWPVTSHSTLKDALYQYDAIARLQDASLDRSDGPPEVGRYVRLGPVGTALLPNKAPRVLLIDELDKSDINLPNDLLNIFEEGQFDIPELQRLPDDQDLVRVMTADTGQAQAAVRRGQVRCYAFPFVVITSNGEREFPPAFLRRCLRLNIQPPTAKELEQIVVGHLGETARAESEQLIDTFLKSRDRGDVATDQLLNAIYLATSGVRPKSETRERLVTSLFSSMDSLAVRE